MTSVLLSGGAGAKDPAWYCLDAAGMGSTTNYLPVWERGFRGMSGYVTHAFDIPPKCIEAWWELPDTWWMMNVEGDPYAGLGGAAVGRKYATDGIARVRDKGHERETALIFSLTDFGPTAPQFPILDETHRAVVDVCLADGQMPGFYGPPVYLRHLAVMPWIPAGTVFWQWGGGGAPEWWTTVKQAGPSSNPPVAHNLTGFGFAADENIVWTPMAGWTGYGGNQKETDDVVKLTLFQVYDGNQLLDAVFVGMADEGWVTEMSWCDGPRLAALGAKNPPCPIQPVQIGQLVGCVLNGALPENDRYHTWTGAEFFRYQAPSKGEKGDKGDPGPAPRGVTFSY